MTPLHEAVHKTANKLLDEPEFVSLCRSKSPVDNKYSRLYSALQPLGYARLSFWDSLDRSDPLPAGGCTLEVHPLAYKYFKEYGEEYVLLLEATQRLTQ